jgi:hypothetical protein
VAPHVNPRIRYRRAGAHRPPPQRRRCVFSSPLAPDRAAGQTPPGRWRREADALAPSAHLRLRPRIRVLHRPPELRVVDVAGNTPPPPPTSHRVAALAAELRRPAHTPIFEGPTARFTFRQGTHRLPDFQGLSGRFSSRKLGAGSGLEPSKKQVRGVCFRDNGYAVVEKLIAKKYMEVTGHGSDGSEVSGSGGA